MAGLVRSGIIEAQNPLAVSLIRTAPWDDFDAPDGSLISGRKTPSGHTWGTTGSGFLDAQINGGGYASDSNVYAYLSDAQTIVEVEGTFSYTPDANQNGTLGTTITIMLSGGTSPSVIDKMIHLTINPGGYNILKSLGATNLVPLANDAVELNGLATPEAASGSFLGGSLRWYTEYKVRMVADTDANTVTLYLPDGTIWQYQDDDISLIVGTAAVWQITSSASGYANPKWTSCAIGPSKAGKVTSPSTNHDTAMMRSLIGFSDVSFGQTLPIPFSPASTGWYTIATNQAASVNKHMGGTVTIYGQDHTDRFCLIKIRCGSELTGSPPWGWLEVDQMLGVWSAIVDQVRISQDSGTGAIQLDVSIGAVNGTRLFIIFEGFFNVVPHPVVGATPLATWNITEAVYTTRLITRNLLPCNIADLPAAASYLTGARGLVINGSQTYPANAGVTVSGTGSNKFPVYCDGTSWKIG